MYQSITQNNKQRETVCMDKTKVQENVDLHIYDGKLSNLNMKT